MRLSLKKANPLSIREREKMGKIIFDTPEMPYTVLDTEELEEMAAWFDEKAEELENGTISQEDQDFITELIMELKASLKNGGERT